MKIGMKKGRPPIKVKRPLAYTLLNFIYKASLPPLCHILLVSQCYLSISKKADTKNEDVQIPNPLTEHETLADLAKTVGFDVTLPTLDKAYKETAFIDISGTIADVRFADDEDTITFRKAKGSDDISGDNKTYKENKTIAVKDVSVSVKGNDGINTATWQKDGFTYSFSSDKAMTQDALVKAIENLF